MMNAALLNEYSCCKWGEREVAERGVDVSSTTILVLYLSLSLFLALSQSPSQPPPGIQPLNSSPLSPEISLSAVDKHLAGRGGSTGGG